MTDRYSVIVLRNARKDIERLHPKIRRQIYDRLQGLASNPRPQDTKRLQGAPGLRIDSGEYRILYEVNDVERIVVVRVIKHRRDAYRNL